jgi:hypothetical protein
VLVARVADTYAGTPPQEFFVELQPHGTLDARRLHPTSRTWQPIRPEESTRLSDSRQQIHHAAQLAAAAGISFLEPSPDDAHTSLEWIPSLSGLFTRPIPAGTVFRVGVRPATPALLIAVENDKVFGEYRLHGKTLAEAASWIRIQASLLGLDAARYTLKRQYEIPRHPLAMDDAFDSSESSCFEELSKWFANAASLLNSLARSIPDAGDVRCWPHHFDLASLIGATPGRTIGIGLEPGDEYYDEPYFYVNVNPRPVRAQTRSRPLWGRGTWHTSGWFGAVLPGSRLGAASAQEQQVREFMDSAISACRSVTLQN